MNLPDSPVAELPRPAPASIKFTYASGARPLEGYTIKRGVGRGGFGEVYFATSDAGKEVAIKLIRRNMDVELRGATQCLNLKHPNLIGLYDIRTDDMGDQWIIMEYVSGESLEDVIERYPQGMPLEQVLSWMRGLCAGVAYLHDHGIVHRDLKPGNIFVDEGTVKIGDYGLAKFISCSRRSGQTESVGTVHYMAPEIANGRYGREIDTYALGIILFEMLTGTVPFEGESVGEVLMKHLTAEPDLTRLQEPYRDIVRRALTKDPEVRIKNVGELLALLPGGGGSSFAPLIVDDGISHDIVLTPIAPNAQAASPRPVRPPRPEDFAPLEEPIWKGIRDGIAYMKGERGEGDPQHRAQRLAIFWAVGVVTLVLCTISGAIIPLAGLGFTGVICYGIYYLIWISAIRPSIERQTRREMEREFRRPVNPLPVGARPLPTEAIAAAASEEANGQWSPAADRTAADRYAQKARRRRMRTNWRERVNLDLAAKPFRDKLRELLGSMLLAAAFVMLISIATPVLGLGGTSTYLWLSFVGTLASWAVLIPAKFTEGKLEDHVPMRLVMLALGVLVGALAFEAGQALLVNLPRGDEPLDAGWGFISHEMLRWPSPPTRHAVAGNPSFAAYVTFFGTLFLLVRWWKQSEYIRSTRLSLWAVAGCVFAAWFAHLFWWFPQPAGVLVAGTVSVATQLASPWMAPSRRRAVSEALEQGVV